MQLLSLNKLTRLQLSCQYENQLMDTMVASLKAHSTNTEVRKWTTGHHLGPFLSTFHPHNPQPIFIRNDLMLTRNHLIYVTESAV